MDPVFDTGAASSACPYGSDCSDCTAYVAATPTSAGYFPTRCGQAAPPARTATSVAAKIATDVKLEANFDAIFDSDDRRRLAAPTSVASPDRNPRLQPVLVTAAARGRRWLSSKHRAAHVQNVCAVAREQQQAGQHDGVNI